MEWRRKGLFVATVFGLSMALSMCLFPLGAALYLQPIETMFHFSYPFILMIIFAGVTGSALAKSDAWSPELGVHPLVATRPLSTCSLVFAKMKSAAIATGLGWALFLVLLFPVLALHGRMYSWSPQADDFWLDFPINFPNFWRWVTNPVVVLALVVATWHTVVQSMMVTLTGDKRHIVRRTWQRMIVLAIVISAALGLYRHQWWVDPFLRFLPWFILAMMGLKAVGAVRAFIAAKKLVSRRDFRVLVGVWILTALLVLSAGVFAHVTQGMPGALLWFLVLWQFFPSGEIPQCVIALTGNRHR